MAVFAVVAQNSSNTKTAGTQANCDPWVAFMMLLHTICGSTEQHCPCVRLATTEKQLHASSVYPVWWITGRSLFCPPLSNHKWLMCAGPSDKATPPVVGIHVFSLQSPASHSCERVPLRTMETYGKIHPRCYVLPQRGDHTSLTRQRPEAQSISYLMPGNF